MVKKLDRAQDDYHKLDVHLAEVRDANAQSTSTREKIAMRGCDLS